MKRGAFLGLSYLSASPEPASVQLTALQKLSQDAIVSSMNSERKKEKHNENHKIQFHKKK